MYHCGSTSGLRAALGIGAKRAAPADVPNDAGLRVRLGLAALQWLAGRSFGTRWRWAERLAWLHLRGDAVFQEVLLTNLNLCFPALNAQQRMQLATANASEHFFALIDRFRCWQLNEQTLRRQVSLDGLNHLAEQRGRPVVLLCPHFLAMEAGIQRLSLEIQTVALHRPSASVAFETLRSKARSRFNRQELVDARGPLLPVMRQVAAGKPLFVLPDLDLGAGGAEFAPFFGIPVATTRTAAWCARTLGAAILPFTVLRTGADHYQATLHAPLDTAGRGIASVLGQTNLFIEAMVRANPAQYWWAHARFATRPQAAAPLYSGNVMRKLAAQASVQRTATAAAAG